MALEFNWLALAGTYLAVALFPSYLLRRLFLLAVPVLNLLVLTTKVSPTGRRPGRRFSVGYRPRLFAL